MLSAVWVHDDFKLVLKLALELHAQSQMNKSVYQPDRIELLMTDSKNNPGDNPS